MQVTYFKFKANDEKIRQILRNFSKIQKQDKIKYEFYGHGNGRHHALLILGYIQLKHLNDIVAFFDANFSKNELKKSLEWVRDHECRKHVIYPGSRWYHHFTVQTLPKE